MEFARKQLEKYGWTDGKGLGKKEDGISEPLKPKLKRSITGVGYDPAKDFTEHWWNKLYDKAASNVQVEDNKGKTKRIKCKDDNFEITNNTFLLKSKNKSKNGNSEEEYKDFFVRTEVFENDGAKIVRVQESESSDENDEMVQMTDEQLYVACNGRTAHKGARHGLRALGKLARIEQQEQILLQESRFNGYSHAKKNKNNQVVEDALINNDQDLNTLKSKKKKNKHCSMNQSIHNVTKLSLSQQNGNVAIIEDDVRKKSKKGEKEMLNDNVTIDLFNDDILKNNSVIDSLLETNNECVHNIESPVNENIHIIEKVDKKSKKRKKETLNNVNNVDLSIDGYVLKIEKDKKSKKRKENLNNDNCGDLSHDRFKLKTDGSFQTNNEGNNYINSEIELNHKKQKKIKTNNEIKDDKKSLEENCSSNFTIKNNNKRKNNSNAIDEFKVTIALDDVITDKISKKVKKKSKSSE